MKILCAGNSHLGMLRQAQPALPADWAIDFAAFQIYEGQRNALRSLLTEGEAELKINRPGFRASFLHGKIRLADYDALLLVGLAGGPGDAFRALAPAAFVGTADEAQVPQPETVGCPVYQPDRVSAAHPPISRAVLDRINGDQFDELQRAWIAPVVAGFPLIVVPTPPMAQMGVRRRFGETIGQSETGTAILANWDRSVAAAVASRPITRAIGVPRQALERGWLLDRYLRVEEPTEFHANGAYAELFAGDLTEAVHALV